MHYIPLMLISKFKESCYKLVALQQKKKTRTGLKDKDRSKNDRDRNGRHAQW